MGATFYLFKLLELWLPCLILGLSRAVVQSGGSADTLWFTAAVVPKKSEVPFELNDISFAHISDVNYVDAERRRMLPKHIRDTSRERGSGGPMHAEHFSTSTSAQCAS